MYMYIHVNTVQYHIPYIYYMYHLLPRGLTFDRALEYDYSEPILISDSRFRYSGSISAFQSGLRVAVRECALTEQVTAQTGQDGDTRLLPADPEPARERQRSEMGSCCGKQPKKRAGGRRRGASWDRGQAYPSGYQPPVLPGQELGPPYASAASKGTGTGTLGLIQGYIPQVGGAGGGMVASGVFVLL